ncbi:MAG: S46 family peptidase [Gemmatimonadota bacterium]
MSRRLLPTALVAALLVPTSIAAQETGPPGLDSDTVTVGRMDFGKMWTFEYPPTEWFQEAYDFEATPEWFERARLSALRIPGCSASFVSPAGLVVTNHHCVRGAVSRVAGPGEPLLDEGFYARTLAAERRIPGYYADHLVRVEDVTDEVYAALEAAPTAGRAEARRGVVERIEARLGAEHGGDDPVHVEVVPLYNGGRFSAYVFRRFTDVRLVAAVELQAGFFGGDPDNFTYPRYALDFAFLRIYDDGEPYEPRQWFTWGEGVEPGDAVFVIGNPGPTNRLKTVAQLEYQRDAYVPIRKAFFETRLQALRDAYAADPVRGEELDLRNRAFSLSNSLKAYTGRLAALQDPYIMARKAAAEDDLIAAIAADRELETEFGRVVDRMADIQARRRAIADAEGAFYLLAHSTYGSRTLLRALGAARIEAARDRGAPADSLADAVAALRRVGDPIASLEEDVLTLRLADLRRYLGEDDPLVEGALRGRTPREAARHILGASVLATQDRTVDALGSEAGLPDDDPALAVAEALLPRLVEHQRAAAALDGPEVELAAALGRARFQVYGTEVAPDATSSPRITDGVVRAYEYNGTLAPPYTTMYGMYDHYYSYRNVAPDWELPERFLPVPEGLDLSTPLNFVSTADTYGGNSGSPAVTRELAIVGLNFDRNIEGLSRDFIYLPERGRNIMVDVRAIREALDVAYDADRIVHEILTGEMVPSEEEADRIGG